ncbi:MAG: 2,3-bisphosphoglycerate-independent phosphoglycerate mutase [Bacteroidota bacterium]
MSFSRRHLLLILDGYGIAEDPSVSAIDQAEKPFLDHLFATYPHATLEASGRAVGLPAGQMGNSEVGHMNLGAGRVVYQDITRIDKAIEDGDFFANEVLAAATRHAKDRGTVLHLLGLFSDGGVHASNEHLYALLELARREGLSREQVVIHAFTDGRDTDPHGALGYAEALLAQAEEIGVGVLGTIVGRYYAMDRDHRWPRTQQAYDLLTRGEGALFDTPAAAIQASYDEGVTDEFITPRRLAQGEARVHVADGDAILFYNFRADRARQLTRAFTDVDFDGFDRGDRLDLHYATFTTYHADFDLPVAFPKLNLADTLGETISRLGGRQLRAAETEKYPHVTFFFSGGREEPFDGEDRLLVNSPQVATYDLQPAMSAPELAQRVAEALATEAYDFVCLNFANPDMVGHTGVFEAAVEAVETIDACTKTVVEAAQAHGYGVTLIADHGNADRMKNPDGSAHTAHTTVPVPHLIIQKGFEGPIQDGKLGDIAPTILTLMGQPVPEAMSGERLV